jgi:D-aminopeptidase
MKVYLMTDLEGVAGVLDADDWVYPNSRYYEEAKRLLTDEVNAAARGFFNAGAVLVCVQDGHGYGGVNCARLDKRVIYQRGWHGPYPFGLDAGYDVCAWVGQHAMSRTKFAHLAHTGNYSVFEIKINGIAVGEFAQLAWCALEHECIPVLACGDLAFTKEAKSFFPGIETVAVKRGVMPGSGDECDASEYKIRNSAAVHIQPERACEMIEQGAYNALLRYKENPRSFFARPPDPPYRLEYYRRANSAPVKVFDFTHLDSITALLNMKG